MIHTGAPQSVAEHYEAGTVPYWPEVEGQRVRVAGGLIHFVDIGDVGAPPVLMLHRLGGWAAEWREAAEELASDHRVIVADLPGHGGSLLEKERSWAHPPSESSAALREFLAHLDTGAVHVLACSLGGVVSLHLAADAPELVRSLTLVRVSLTERHTLERTLEIDRASRAHYTSDWLPLPFGDSREEDPEEAEQNAARAQAGPWLRASERGFGLSGIQHRLHEVQAPVLYLNGVDAPYRKYEETAQHHLPEVRVKALDVRGAFPHRSSPATVVHEWRQFTGEIA